MSKILVISEKYWPYGGAELATHLILKLLRDEGSRITVLTGSRRHERISGIKYIYHPLLDVASKIHLWLNLLKPDRYFEELIRQSNVVYIPIIAYPVIPLAKENGKKVIVHLHNYQPITYNSIILANWHSNTPNNISFEARYEVYEHGSIKRAILGSMLVPTTYLSRLWVRQADVIICASKRQAEIVAEKAPELRHKIRVVYNPLPNVPLIEKRLGEPTFLYLGGDSYVKGFYVFLDATRQILKHHHNVKFLLTRSFRDSNKLRFMKLNRRFEGAYDLLGYLKHEDALRLHERSYALLFPSICEEPLPYVVLEFMLAGTIPITSKIGGVPGWFEGRM